MSQGLRVLVLNGLRIMGHGWPQGFAVAIMRRVRPDLEREHARILRQDPHKLFDPEAIRAAARPQGYLSRQHRSSISYPSFEGAARI
jgi:hypothetical protein